MATEAFDLDSPTIRVAGSSLPPRDAGLTDVTSAYPTLTPVFDLRPLSDVEAQAWAKWQGAPDLGPDVRGSLLSRLLDRVSRWCCDTLPETLLMAAGLVVAWADGHSSPPRRPEPYRATYTPARYVAAVAAPRPQRVVSAAWLIARIWNEDEGVSGLDPVETDLGRELTTQPQASGEYVGSHRHELTPGTEAQRNRSLREQQTMAIRSATAALDLRDRLAYANGEWRWVDSDNTPNIDHTLVGSAA